MRTTPSGCRWYYVVNERKKASLVVVVVVVVVDWPWKSGGAVEL